MPASASLGRAVASLTVVSLTMLSLPGCGGARSKLSGISPEQAVANARAALAAQLRYTTTFAFGFDAPGGSTARPTAGAQALASLGPLADGFHGSIDGQQESLRRVKVNANVGFTAPGAAARTGPVMIVLYDGRGSITGLTDPAVSDGAAQGDPLGRLALVPADLDRLLTGTGAGAGTTSATGTGPPVFDAGKARGTGQRTTEDERIVVAPELVQARAADFFAQSLSLLVGPVSAAARAAVQASLEVNGATLDVYLRRDDGRIDSIALRLTFSVDGSTLEPAIGPYVATDRARAITGVPQATVPGAANFRMTFSEYGQPVVVPPVARG